jgi:hypothetical protein
MILDPTTAPTSGTDRGVDEDTLAIMMRQDDDGPRPNLRLTRDDADWDTSAGNHPSSIPAGSALAIAC